MAKTAHTYENALTWRRKQSRRAWRPLFRSASEDEKKCYQAIWNGLTKRDTVIEMPLNDPDIVEKALEKCLADDPVLFDTGTFQLSMSPVHTAVLAEYNMDNEEFTNTVMAVRESVMELKYACRDKSRSETIRYLHDYIVRNITYERNEDPSIHRSWHVFVHHKGVCDGIAKAVKILLDSCHIPSQIIEGTAAGEGHEEGHAWNLIEEDGRWYHYDFTFDNTLSEGGHEIHYDYYRLTESQIRRDHTFTAPLSVTQAVTEEDWFRQNDCYFTSKKKLRAFIRSCLREQKKSFTFRLPYTKDPLATRDAIYALVQGELVKGAFFARTYSASFNEHQMVMTFYLQ